MEKRIIKVLVIFILLVISLNQGMLIRPVHAAPINFISQKQLAYLQAPFGGRMQVAWFGSTNNRAHERGNNEDQATSLLTLNNTTIGAGLPPAPGAVPQQTTTSKAKSGATTAESTVDFKADVAGAVLLPPKPGGGAGNYVIKDRVYGQINATPLTIDKTYASGVSEVKFRELVMRSGVWKPRTSTL